MHNHINKLNGFYKCHRFAAELACYLPKYEGRVNSMRGRGIMGKPSHMIAVAAIHKFIEFNFLLAIFIVNYFFYYIKFVLRRRGHSIKWLVGWGKDLRRFKHLIASEVVEDTKSKYTTILWGLYISLGYMILVAFIGTLVPW